MNSAFQTTLADAVTLRGVGVHSGEPVTVTLHPADAGSGITFLRTGLSGGREREISARHVNVIDTVLCTMIGDKTGASIGTIEHVMGALSGLGVDNVLIEVDGPEMPILDGSARPFVEAIDSVGLDVLRSRRRLLKILKPVRVEQGRAFAELLPATSGFHLDISVDFDNPVIGFQRRSCELTPDRFRKDIAAARTFGFLSDLETLRENGLALGASLENAVAIDGERILNPEGLRFADEFARHKMLDAIGDLALAGSVLQGSYKSFCAGHRLNVLAVKALLADSSAWSFDEMPSRREIGYADRPLRVAAHVFAADK